MITRFNTTTETDRNKKKLYVKISVIAKFNKSRYVTKKKWSVCHVFLIVFLCAHNMVAREYLIQSANDFTDHIYHKLPQFF